MTNKAIFNIEVNTAQWDEFQKKWKEYQESLQKMPQAWADTGKEIEADAVAIDTTNELYEEWLSVRPETCL